MHSHASFGKRVWCVNIHLYIFVLSLILYLSFSVDSLDKSFEVVIFFINCSYFFVVA